jgi:DNA polymerase-3 subunit epsilon
VKAADVASIPAEIGMKVGRLTAYGYEPCTCRRG